MRAVVGDGLVRGVVGADPLHHPLHELRVVPVPEQSPLRVRDRLAALGRELHLVLQPVRLAHVVVEGAAGRLVVAVHAQDVDHVVPRVALRPRDRVQPPVRREVEPEALTRHRAHHRDDPPPVRLPGGRVGLAAVGVGDAVHLPAEGEHGVRATERHQTPGQLQEVPVEVAARALGQQPGHLAVRHVRLVRHQHRHTEDQHPGRVRLAPLRPQAEHHRLSLDVRPAVARQIGVPDLQVRVAQPLRVPADLRDVLVPGTDEGPERRLVRRPLHHRTGRGPARRDPVRGERVPLRLAQRRPGGNAGRGEQQQGGGGQRQAAESHGLSSGGSPDGAAGGAGRNSLGGGGQGHAQWCPDCRQ